MLCVLHMIEGVANHTYLGGFSDLIANFCVATKLRARKVLARHHTRTLKRRKGSIETVAIGRNGPRGLLLASLSPSRCSGSAHKGLQIGVGVISDKALYNALDDLFECVKALADAPRYEVLDFLHEIRHLAQRFPASSPEPYTCIWRWSEGP